MNKKAMEMLNTATTDKRLITGLSCTVLLWGAILALPGCLSETRIREDLARTRRVAYEEWQRERKAAEGSKAFLQGELNLQDAIKVALQFNRDIQIFFAEKEVTAGQVLAAWQNALPTLTGTAGYTRLGKNNRPATTHYDNYSAALTVTQPVFKGGQIRSALRAAKLGTILADESIRAQVQATIFIASQTYYDAVLARHLLEVNRVAVQSAELQLRDARIKKQQGVASDFDVLRAEVDVANFRTEMIKQKNAMVTAKASLLKTLGVSQESTVTLVTELQFKAMKPVFEKAVEVAYQNRPDLTSGELNVRLQEEAVQVARSAYWPQINASFQEAWSRPDVTAVSDEWDRTWSAGGSATWSLFDGFGREGQIRQESATLKRRHIELLQTQEQALLDIQTAIVDLANAEELVDAQSVNLKKAARGLQLAVDGYREGVNTQVEVTDARSALTTAQGNYYEAVYAHSLARLSLYLAMGVLGPRYDEEVKPEAFDPHAIEPAEFSEPVPDPDEGRIEPAANPAPINAKTADLPPLPEALQEEIALEASLEMPVEIPALPGEEIFDEARQTRDVSPVDTPAVEIPGLPAVSAVGPAQAASADTGDARDLPAEPAEVLEVDVLLPVRLNESLEIAVTSTVPREPLPAPAVSEAMVENEAGDEIDVSIPVIPGMPAVGPSPESEPSPAAEVVLIESIPGLPGTQPSESVMRADAIAHELERVPAVPTVETRIADAGPPALDPAVEMTLAMTAVPGLPPAYYDVETVSAPAPRDGKPVAKAKATVVTPQPQPRAMVPVVEIPGVPLKEEAPVKPEQEEPAARFAPLPVFREAPPRFREDENASTSTQDDNTPTFEQMREQSFVPLSRQTRETDCLPKAAVYGQGIPSLNLPADWHDLMSTKSSESATDSLP